MIVIFIFFSFDRNYHTSNGWLIKTTDLQFYKRQGMKMRGDPGPCSSASQMTWGETKFDKGKISRLIPWNGSVAV
jgi:hypothetical protein